MISGVMSTRKGQRSCANASVEKFVTPHSLEDRWHQLHAERVRSRSVVMNSGLQFLVKEARSHTDGL